MKKILFVCHGNICRSPMAEYIMKDMVCRAEIEEDFKIASAATSSEELGNPVYPQAQKELAAHGIGCAGHRARRISRRDYDEYDLLIGMDAANLRNMYSVFDGDPDGKLHLLMDYTGSRRDVADPWYTRDFGAAWSDIQSGCSALLTQLTEKQY